MNKPVQTALLVAIGSCGRDESSYGEVHRRRHSLVVILAVLIALLRLLFFYTR